VGQPNALVFGDWSIFIKSCLSTLEGPQRQLPLSPASDLHVDWLQL
jgi:hypothetical protein